MKRDFPTMMRIEDVKQATGLPKSTLYDQMSKGQFPRPRKIGPRAVAWLSSEIETWLNSRPMAA